MKYMGSKRMMLTNGFGQAIVEQSAHSTRIVDLFAGSAAVVWYAAERTNLPVHAYDLQEYSVVLARAIVGRTTPIDVRTLDHGWLRSTRRALSRSKHRHLWSADYDRLAPSDICLARRVCADEHGPGPIWRAYGGHYFSPVQAIAIDLALKHLPASGPERSLCHAAVIAAASYCAAAPGHTAQPFQPTPTAIPYIAATWNRDPLRKIGEWLTQMAGRHAQQRGRAMVGDALVKAKRLTKNDLVIVDPPYSAVQYSRFYHVLETVAQQRDAPVAGVGRYPPPSARPSSDFSLRTQSQKALTELLDALAAVECRVLLTFPAGESSNGLSGGRVVELARERFKLTTRTVLGRFSTLGGNNTVRASRHSSAEMILALTPKP